MNQHDEVLLSIKGYGEIHGTVRHVSDDGNVGLMFKKALIGDLPN